VIAEAIDTVITLGWALLVWVVLLSLAAALALHAVMAITWWALRALCRAARAAWRDTDGPAWARSRIGARRYARRTRPTYDEAA
jgi:hypothetical protein